MAAPLFSPHHDFWLRTALVAIPLGATSTIAGLVVYMHAPDAYAELLPIDQPVEFDHRHHVVDDAISCLYCHSGAERSAAAGVPSSELCMGCHGQIWSESSLLEPVRRSYFSGEPLRWNRVNELPDFVYFDHSVHLASGVGCVSCHGRVDRMPRVYKVASLSMTFCLDCHRDPGPHLQPRETVADPNFDPSSLSAQARRELVAAYAPRELTHCSTCHR